MAYSDTETFGYTAAGTTLTDFMTSIISHFTTAPGRWGLNAVTPVATEALAITRTSGPLVEIGIRREGTTELVSMMDDGAAITSVGGTATSAIGSAVAFPDSKSLAWPGSLSADFDIIEHDQAITILFYSAVEDDMPVALHVGRGMKPLRDNDVALGMTGSINLIGTPGATSSGGGVGTWFRSSVGTDGSRVRVFDSGGVAQFAQAHAPLSPESGSSSRAGTNLDGTVMSVRPLLINAVSVNGSHDLDAGITEWIGSAPISTTPSLPNHLPRVRLDTDVADNEGWAYTRGAASITGLVVNTQRGINLA